MEGWIASSISSWDASRAVARFSVSTEAAAEAGGAEVVGGGGRGLLFSSPMRRSVSVSWAFVGMPFRRVLHGAYY